MELNYIRDLTHNYMVVKPAQETEDFTLRMALTQNINGLVPVEARLINDELYLYYRTDSLLSLENRSLLRKLGRRELQELFRALSHIENVLADYLIGMDSVCLLPETIFTDPADGSWRFTCMPFAHPEATLFAFCEALPAYIDSEDKDAMADAYRICERAQEQNVRISDLMRLFADEPEAVSETQHRELYIEETPVWQYEEAPRKETGKKKTRKKETSDEEISRHHDVSMDTEDAETSNKKEPLVRPGILALLFTVILLADFYIRKNYLLTGAGNILSLVVAGVCLAGAVGSFLASRKKDGRQEEVFDAGWTDASGYELWEDVYAQEEEPVYDDGVLLREDAEETEEEEEWGTVLLTDTGNRRSAKLYGRNRVNNCNIALDRLPLTLGKLAGKVDMQLLDKSVSRIHAHIRKDEDGRIVVKDMNSTNGTYHNGVRLRPNESVHIRTGDELCFGNMVFEYL